MLPAQYRLQKILRFPLWWYFETPGGFLRLLAKLTIFLDHELAASLMLRFLFVPLFQDVSIIGRTLSFIFRFFRAVFGFLAIALFDFALILAFLAFLTLPPAVLVFTPEVFLIALLLTWAGFTGAIWNQPLKTIRPLKSGQSPLPFFTPEAIKFLSLTVNKDNFIASLLSQRGIAAINQRLEGRLDELPSKVGGLPKNLAEGAYQEAFSLGAAAVTPNHLLLATVKEASFFYEDIYEVASWFAQYRDWGKFPFVWQKEFIVYPMGGVNRAWTARPTPFLDRISRDLTEAARRHRLKPIFGKREVIEKVVRILGLSGRENVLITGEPGSGKTTLAGGIAQAIVRGTAEKSLRFKRLVALDVAALTAGADTPGAINERVVRLLQEIRAAGNIILFVDEVHNLALSTVRGEASIFASFEPSLDASDFQFIGTTDRSDYKRFIEPNPAFARVFQTIELPEASLDETLKILEYTAWELEWEAPVSVSYFALKEAIRLSQRFIHNRVLPDKAVAVLTEAFGQAKEQGLATVTAELVAGVVSEKTKIPLKQITQEEKEALLGLEEEIHRRIVNQDEAVAAVANALRRSRVGLKKEDRPIASFLFVGPTGVGKTETAQAVSAVYFGSEQAMIRLDMSEYQDAESLHRLLGAPPGHRGAEEGGQLTEAVGGRPYTLLLLDEIEKAHPGIIDIFLQVLDEGRLTDSQGRTADFTNTIIVATSNVGTALITEEIRKGKKLEEIKNQAMAELEKRFRHEFLNRFSRIVVYRPLTISEVEEIARILLADLSSRLAKKEIKLEVDPKLVVQLAQKGFDPEWGARPLRRLIEEEIESNLAKKILRGELKKGSNATLDTSYLQP